MTMRLWPGLLAASLVLALSSVINGLKPPVLIGCVFVHNVNVTCTWEPGDSHTTNYTLNVLRTEWKERFRGNINTSRPEKLWRCPTTNTSCTVKFTSRVTEPFSVKYNFCVSITANSDHGGVTSEPRCQPGIKEVLLPPVTLDRITPVTTKPNCLMLTWMRDPTMFPIAQSQMKNGELKSQIEFTAQRPEHKRVRNVVSNNLTFEACVFSPGTLYSVRLRHRYNSTTSPWSLWSNERQGKTAEGVPSAAPMFWRKVLHQDEHRLTSLLWKALPHHLSNGRILSYNVTCCDENAKVLRDQGNCSHLNISHSSCVLKLPLGPCSCSISASTSAGPSPRACVWLSKANEKEGPPPSQLSVTAVSKRSLELKWALPFKASSLTGFIVEWFEVTQQNDSQRHWVRVNSSTTAVNITEGVGPFQRHSVSVRALYGKKGAGESKTAFVYTQQGAPSAAPQISRLQISGNTVNLSWSLPVEQQRGFIRNYTLFYRMNNQPVKSVVLNGSTERHLLSLSPGSYLFWMQASTEAGAGAPGSPHPVKIGQEEMSVVLYILLPTGFISLALIVMICAAQSEIVKGKLCQEIPDPSHSSMADWSPKTITVMNFTQPGIQFSEVTLLSNPERENYDSDEDIDLPTCFYPAASTHYNPFKWDTKYHTSSNMVDTNFTSCPVIYPISLVPNEHSSSLLELQHNSYPNVKYHSQPQEGGSELCLFNPKGTSVNFSQTQDPDIAFPFACVASQSPEFNVKSFSSTPLLKSDFFFQTETLQQNTSVSQLPFPDLFPIDFISLLQSPTQCDPYLPV